MILKVCYLSKGDTLKVRTISSLSAGLGVFVHAVADMLHNTCHSLIHGHTVLLFVAAEAE